MLIKAKYYIIILITLPFIKHIYSDIFFKNNPLYKINRPTAFTDNSKENFREKNNIKDNQRFQKAFNLLYQDSNYLESYILFKKLSKKYKNNHVILYFVATSSLMLGEFNYYPGKITAYEEAFDFCNKAIEFDPQNPKYKLLMSYILIKKGLFKRSKEKGLLSGISFLRKALNIINLLINQDELDSFDHEKYDFVIDRLGEIGIQALIGRAEAYRDSPRTLFGGNKDLALHILKHINIKFPNHARGIYVLAKTYEKLNRLLDAEKLFLSLEELYSSGVIPKAPINHYIYAQLPYSFGKVLWKLRKYNQACVKFEEHIKRYTRSPWGHQWMSYCFKKSNNIDSAKIMLEKAIEYEPFNDNYKKELSMLN